MMRNRLYPKTCRQSVTEAFDAMTQWRVYVLYERGGGEGCIFVSTELYSYSTVQLQ
jgi:hypothetical protein